VRRSRVLGAAAGSAALVLLIWHTGLGDIAAHVRGSGYLVAAVLLASGLRLLLQTCAWATALRAEGCHESLPQLIGIRLASQATGYLAALGPIVSEPTKVFLLRKVGMTGAIAPATLVETGMYWFITVLLGLAGTFAAGLLVADASIVFAPLAVFAAAAGLLLARRPLLSHLIARVGAHAPRWLRAAAEVEEQIRSFRLRHPQAAWRLLILDAAAQVLTLAEVAGALWTAGLAPSIPGLLAIEAAVRMVKIAAAWIPGRIGVDEGGAMAAFALLGFPSAAGLMLALARRARDGLWCLLGVFWLTISGVRGAPIKPGRTPSTGVM